MKKNLLIDLLLHDELTNKIMTLQVAWSHMKNKMFFCLAFSGTFFDCENKVTNPDHVYIFFLNMLNKCEFWEKF